MTIDTPEYMPSGEPSRTSDCDVLERRDVPGISFHKEGDGVVHYYDSPVVFVAWYDGVMVLATLVDDDFEGPPAQARGWSQHFLVEVETTSLMEAYSSDADFRSLYERPGARTWFIHEDWRRAGEAAWERRLRVWDDVPVPDDLKPDAGLRLDRTRPADS